MTLAQGDTAPDFELPDQTGTPRKLSTLLQDGPVVLFFYPIALSGGCTAEACHFRDLAKEFVAAGGRPIGISKDPVAKQAEFDSVNSLGYPLLSDVDQTVIAGFGVKRKLIPFNKRVTFVINTDRTIREAIASERSMTDHANQALTALRG